MLDTGFSMLDEKETANNQAPTFKIQTNINHQISKCRARKFGLDVGAWDFLGGLLAKPFRSWSLGFGAFSRAPDDAQSDEASRLRQPEFYP
jgi:hypothetical protein